MLVTWGRRAAVTVTVGTPLLSRLSRCVLQLTNNHIFFGGAAAAGRLLATKTESETTAGREHEAPGAVASASSPDAAPFLAALPTMESTGQWKRLASEFILVRLEPHVLRRLLALDEDQAAELHVALHAAGVRTVGALLTAAEKINESASGFSAVGKLSALHANFLQDIAALRDKVRTKRTTVDLTVCPRTNEFQLTPSNSNFNQL